jgi:hypothetical protein
VKAAVKDTGRTFWHIHNCSFCGYDCGYVFEGDLVGYDSGCHCTYRRGGIEPRSWDSVAECINMQNDEWSQKLWDELNSGPTMGEPSKTDDK